MIVSQSYPWALGPYNAERPGALGLVMFIYSCALAWWVSPILAARLVSEQGWFLLLAGAPAGDALIGGERRLSRLGMIHDRLWIGLSERHAGRRQLPRCRDPGLVDHAIGQFRQFRHPVPHIGALGVELLALQHRVEHAEERRGVGAAAGDPLPVAAVLRRVGIDQGVPEPFLPALPGNQQVLH